MKFVSIRQSNCGYASLSSRRAWIEIEMLATYFINDGVALLTEGVD